MSRRRLAGLGAPLGWQLPVEVTLGAVLMAVAIGLLLPLVGPARDSGTRRGAPAAPTAPWNTADAAYAQAMLWHREQAGQMASLVQGRTSRPELRGLTRSIRAARSSDFAQIMAWLRAQRAADSSDDAARGPTEPAGRWFAGMIAASQMQTLAATTGQRFDFLFVDMLLEHHKGAIVMADGVLADGRDPQVQQLASRARTDSQRAIGQLTGWRRRWAEPFFRQLPPPAVRSTPTSPSLGFGASSVPRCARGRRGAGSDCSCTDPTGAGSRASPDRRSRCGR
jgi:uncharacterized protein (DUF305 family)